MQQYLIERQLIGIMRQLPETDGIKEMISYLEQCMKFYVWDDHGLLVRSSTILASEMLQDFLIHPMEFDGAVLGNIIRLIGAYYNWSSAIMRTIMRNIPGGFDFHPPTSMGWDSNMTYRIANADAIMKSVVYILPSEMIKTPYYTLCHISGAIGYGTNQSGLPRLYFRDEDEMVLGALKLSS